MCMKNIDGYKSQCNLIPVFPFDWIQTQIHIMEQATRINFIDLLLLE
jgi:hypothetical protein